MGWEALLAIGVAVGVLVALATDRLPAELVVLGGLVVLLVSGVLTPQAAFAGFANPGVVALAGLYVLTAALRETGALDRPAHRLLSTARTVPQARRRITVATTAMSAFLNNTPVVAMFMPLATTWARRTGVSAYGLLMPLSYAAVLGGTCTLMGTSTHLVVHGLLLEAGLPGLELFELLPIGLPVALVGVPLTWFLASRLLRAPERPRADARSARREYTTDLRVTAEAPFLTQSVEDAGLRHLEGLFLIQIERAGTIIAPVGPAEPLHAGDRLTFAGVVDTIVDLQRRRGLVPADAEEPAGLDWRLHEAVVSRGSRLVGRSIREANFRGAYNAAVVAVHRHGERIQRKVGDIVLHAGDTLLLQAAAGFARTFRDSTDFYLVSELSAEARPRHARAPIAVAVMLGVVALAASRTLPLASAAIAGATMVVATGCLSPGAARRSLDLSVLLVIAAALGLARALEQTGAAGALADALTSLGADLGPVGMLAIIYACGMVLTELITNTAAAALLFPIALAAAEAAGVDPRPFAVATSVAASISLATPLGYQTNMMVYGPGGYRFVDFLRMGVPLQIVCGVIAVTALTIVYGL